MPTLIGRPPRLQVGPLVGGREAWRDAGGAAAQTCRRARASDPHPGEFAQLSAVQRRRRRTNRVSGKGSGNGKQAEDRIAAVAGAAAAPTCRGTGPENSRSREPARLQTFWRLRRRRAWRVTDRGSQKTALDRNRFGARRRPAPFHTAQAARRMKWFTNSMSPPYHLHINPAQLV